jgi:hypothetical protein
MGFSWSRRRRCDQGRCGLAGEPACNTSRTCDSPTTIMCSKRCLILVGVILLAAETRVYLSARSHRNKPEASAGKNRAPDPVRDARPALHGNPDVRADENTSSSAELSYQEKFKQIQAMPPGRPRSVAIYKLVFLTDEDALVSVVNDCLGLEWPEDKQAVFEGLAASAGDKSISDLESLSKNQGFQPDFRNIFINALAQKLLYGVQIDQAFAKAGQMAIPLLEHALLDNSSSVNPAGLMEYLASPAGDAITIPASHVERIANRFMEAAPSGSADWALSLADRQPAEGRFALQYVFHGWMQHDSIAASEYVKNLPPGNHKDVGIETIVDYTIIKNDRESALAWINSLNSDALKKNLLEKLAQR